MAQQSVEKPIFALRNNHLFLLHSWLQNSFKLDANTIRYWVYNYYYSGQEDGPILTDFKLCTSVKSLEYETAADPKAVSMGEAINVVEKYL